MSVKIGTQCNHKNALYHKYKNVKQNFELIFTNNEMICNKTQSLFNYCL
jgi:hypothetical protein